MPGTPLDNFPLQQNNLTPMEDASLRARRLLESADGLSLTPNISPAAMSRFAAIARREFKEAAAHDEKTVRQLIEDSHRFAVTMLQIAARREKRNAPLTPPKPK